MLTLSWRANLKSESRLVLRPLPASSISCSILVPDLYFSRRCRDMIPSSSQKIVLCVARSRDIALGSISSFRIQARYNSSVSEEHTSLEQPSPVKRAGSSNKIKTIKKYNALPNRLISSNGTAANPLPAWNGGLSTCSDEKSQDASG